MLTNAQSKFWVNRILWVCSIVSLCITVLIVFTIGNYHFDSDSAATVNFALEQLRSDTVFPCEWVSSTQPFVLFISIPINIVLRFTRNYLIAKNIAQLIIASFLFLSVLFFSRKFLLSDMWLLLVPVLFSAVSYFQYDMLFLNCAYTQIIISIYVSLSLFSVACNCTDKQKYIYIIILIIYLFLNSLLGIVLLQGLGIPLIGAIILEVWYEKKDMHPKEVLQQNGMLYIALAAVAVFIIGEYISLKYICPKMGIMGNDLARFSTLPKGLLDNLSQMLAGFLGYSGFVEGLSMLSINGIFVIIKILIMFMITIVFPILAFKNINNVNIVRRFFYFFAFVHVLEVLVILSMGSAGTDWIATARYELSSIVILNTVSCDYVYEKYMKQFNITGFFFLLAVLAFCLSCNIPELLEMKYYNKQKWELYSTVNYLRENELSFGFAEFWDAGKNTILSNGDIQISGVLINQDDIKPHYWLTSKRWYEPRTWDGRTFLLLKDSDYDLFISSGQSDSKYGVPSGILEYNGYHIIIYDYNLANNRFEGLPGITIPLIHKMSISDNSMVQDDSSIIIYDDQVMFGPYIDLSDGSYELIVEAICENDAELKITIDSGAEILKTVVLNNGENRYLFSCMGDKNQIEFVVNGIPEQEVQIKAISLMKMDQE